MSHLNLLTRAEKGIPLTAQDYDNTMRAIEAASNEHEAAIAERVRLSELGTAATRDATEFATAAQGARADTAVQPNQLPDPGLVAVAGVVDVDGAGFTNHITQQDEVAVDYTFTQPDTGREKIFTGAVAANWTVPALVPGSHLVVHNMGLDTVTFAGGEGVTLKGLFQLGPDKTCSLSWLPRGIVKLLGELT